ncbi:DUF262 domain-containing protein, partial [Dolichospermum sp. LEGE 00240]|uniref:DUF262 domain-containing protein n=1 Tax=Dolichospermum sp. LEGE 00240 TaxID=1828603 RepID=UPI001D134F77
GAYDCISFKCIPLYWITSTKIMTNMIKLNLENKMNSKIQEAENEKNIFDEIEEAEEIILYEDDSYQVPPDDLIAYNELRSCADLFRMYKQEILMIQPEFQREAVWRNTDQTRFIDSLIKQLPIPSMCFSVDYKTRKWQVIDGLQRMSAIIRFFSDENWRLSNLPDIDPKISGKQVKDFHDSSSDLYPYYERIENLTLPITVLRCDYSKKSHTNYLFTIFHRLNTGGIKLNNQEIRNCIYNGSFNNRLKQIDQYSAWINVNKEQGRKKHRFITVQILLRFFAFYDEHKKYNGRLAKFLNDYMEKNRNLDENKLDKKEELFKDTVDIMNDHVTQLTQRKSIAVLESVMFGIASNLNIIKSMKQEEIRSLFNKLLQHNSLSPDVLKEDLASKDKVIARLNAAREIFSGL